MLQGKENEKFPSTRLQIIVCTHMKLWPGWMRCFSVGKMECSEDSGAKRVRLLSSNQICETVMDSNSDKAEYNASVTGIKKWSQAHLRQSPNSQTPSSPDFSTSTSEDGYAIHNVAGQLPQFTQCTLSPYLRRRAIVGTSLLPGRTFSPNWRDWSENVCVLGPDITGGA